jgi:CO/xanthine dehydrogenase FAD-binding subunit
VRQLVATRPPARGRSSARSPAGSPDVRCGTAARSAATSARTTRPTTLPPLLVALDASFTIRGSGGERTVPAHEFFLGVYMTAGRPGEL